MRAVVPARQDFATLGIRLRALFYLRVGLLLVVPAVSVPAASASGAVRVVAVTVVVAALAFGVELWRRRADGVPHGVTNLMLLVDGAYIALAVALTGGTDSLLLFVIQAHVIAVTLLNSWRTGLKIGLWYALLMTLVYQAQATGALPGGAEFWVAAYRMVGFMSVAAVTALLASINERAQAKGKAEFRELAEMSRRLDNADGAVAVVCELLASLTSTYEFRRVAAKVVTSEGLFLVVAEGGEVGEPQALPSQPPGEVELMARAVGHAVLVGRVPEDGNPVLGRALPKARNVAVVPLMASENEVVGVVAAERGLSVDRMPAATVTMLEQFCSHAGLAVKNAELLTEVQRLATTDSLTGLANRRVFEDHLAQEVARYRRTREPFSVVLLDIDHFKRINDTQGHQVGDEVLREFGKALAASCREVDVPARYGGEEFVVILPGVGADVAVEAADRLRRAVSSAGDVVRFTSSAGVATFGVNGGTADEVIHAADEALYAAKAAGRDRTVQSGARGSDLAGTASR